MTTFSYAWETATRPDGDIDALWLDWKRRAIESGFTPVEGGERTYTEHNERRCSLAGEVTKANP